MKKIITITHELIELMHSNGLTAETLAPVVGLTSSTFSLRKHGIVSWELDRCYQILDVLGEKRENIYKYFIGGKHETHY